MGWGSLGAKGFSISSIGSLAMTLFPIGLGLITGLGETGSRLLPCQLGAEEFPYTF